MAIKPEEKSSLSYTKIYQSGDIMKLEIEADSLSELRAALNSWLRMIKMCQEIEVLV
uniref:KEOPS complex Pcc1-like subunit n=1 Tax=Archaeoglobus fulgidus TaxID=2234 RepID=A0A7J2TJS1_ARCFL